MPRRVVTKCQRRGTPADQLDRCVEMNLTDGHAFGPWDIHTRSEFARPWAVWRDEITRRWVAAFPGSRPLAAYILGEIEPPPWRAEFRQPMRRIDGVEVRMPGHNYHKQLAELEHLDELGLIDDDEWELAVQRLAGPEATYHGRYRSIADDQDDERRRG